MGALLVNGLSPWHPQGHDQVAPPLEEDRAGSGKVLHPGNGVPFDPEPGPKGLELLFC